MIPIFPAFVIPAQAPAAAPILGPSPKTVGRLAVSWKPATGLSVTLDSVPLIRQSSLYIVKAGWNGVLFDQKGAAWKVTDWRPVGTSSVATIEAENDSAKVVYRLAFSADGAFRIALSTTLKTDQPAELEYAAGYVNANILQGAPFVASPAAKAKRVSLASPAPNVSQEKNRLAPPFESLAFQTRLGDISIGYSGNAPRPVLFDARSENQAWASAAPTFWMGIGSPAPPLTKQMGEQSAEFVVRVGPRPEFTAPKDAVDASGAATELADAFAPQAPKTVVVIPTPKEMTVGKSPLRLTPNLAIVAPDSEQRNAGLLADAIQARFGFRPKIVRESSGAFAGPTIRLDGKLPGGKRPGGATLSPPEKPEGYAVSVDEKGAKIVGRDDAGRLWAVQTLIQLLSADARGPRVEAAQIRDWPTLSVRGVHLFYGQNARAFQEKLIDRVFSPLKLNTLVIQAEQVRWDADPLVAPPWAGRPADLVAQTAFAKARGITMVPLIQSYGHMEWLFSKPQNRAFAEDPEMPYALNMSNPDAISYIERINDEADKTFGAPAFHAGLDEVTMRGRFPFKSTPRTLDELFITNAKYWHQFAKTRGKELWIWGDMLLHRSDAAPGWGSSPDPATAKKIRDGLPKDTVILDWQYGALENFPSLKLLRDAGFSKVIASTWFNAANIRNLSAAAAKAGAIGGLQTTWCGYESKESVLETTERRQFTAMVLAAEYFWNGGGPKPESLAYDFSEAFREKFAGPDARKSRIGSGYSLELSGARPIGDALGTGDRLSLSGGGARLLDGVRYKLSESALGLRGSFSPDAPKSVTIGLPPGAREVRIVLAASHRVEIGATLGEIKISGAGGFSRTVALQYGKTIAALSDLSAVGDAGIVSRGKTRENVPAVLRALVIPVESGARTLTVTSAGGESAPIVFAVTTLR